LRRGRPPIQWFPVHSEASRADGYPPCLRQTSHYQANREKTAVKKKADVAAAKPKAISAPVVTLKAVFEQLGETHALPKKQARGLLADFAAAMTLRLKKTVRIHMRGLGTLEVKTRAACMGHNPAMGRDHTDQGQQESDVSRAAKAQRGCVGEDR
jgi:DNA-binding protein HU-beta